MTPRTLTSCSLAVLLLGGAWLVSPGNQQNLLRADPPDVDQDSDGDFLPDAIEWACMTNALRSDTDSDGVDDFVEVVQRANPRVGGDPLPADHEMRIVVTTHQTATGNLTYLHLLFRFMGSSALLTNLSAWAEIAAAPGLQIPLETVVGGTLSVHQRVVANEGLWVRVTVPLVSEQVMRMVLPCTIGAHAVIGSRSIQTAVPLFERGSTIYSIVPYGDSLFAVQSICSFANYDSPSTTNRVCVLQLAPLGGGSGGSAFEVIGAECLDCNDLVCGPDCSSSVGTVIVLPGGVGAITGG